MLISKKAREEFRSKYQPSADLSGRIRSYQRVSGDGVGQDVRRQIKLFDDFCKSRPNLTDKLVYREISTSKGGYVRKKFEDMKKASKANQFDILHVDQVSRLGRDVREGLNSVYELMETGCLVYIEQFSKVFDPTDDNDVAMLTFYFMVSERENRWNSRQTKISMEAKLEMLQEWAKDEGLELGLNVKGEAKTNNPNIFEMYSDDPFYNAEKSPKKLGLVCVGIPHMKEMFATYLQAGYSWSGLAELFKKSVNPKCKYGCWTGKKMPFGGLPRHKGNREKGTKRTTMAEVAKFINSGGWTPYTKLDKDVRKEAFFDKSGKPCKKKCGCGTLQSEVTISRWKSEICYKTGLVEKSRPDAFKTLDADSHEVPLDELMDMVSSGKVRSS